MGGRNAGTESALRRGKTDAIRYAKYTVEKAMRKYCDNKSEHKYLCRHIHKDNLFDMFR